MLSKSNLTHQRNTLTFLNLNKMGRPKGSKNTATTKKTPTKKTTAKKPAAKNEPKTNLYTLKMYSLLLYTNFNYFIHFYNYHTFPGPGRRAGQVVRTY